MIAQPGIVEGRAVFQPSAFNQRVESKESR